MAESEITLQNPFIRGLACAALSSALRTVLVFDMSAAELLAAADIWAQMLQLVTEQPVLQLTLGSTAQEDDLWGKRVVPGSSKEAFIWQHGLFMPSPEDQQQLLVVIPDLTQLSLAAMRACVTLATAEVAHLERHGEQARWQPKICWLVSCASNNVGQLSPHLLDRFMLRLSAPQTVHDSSGRVQRLLAHLACCSNSFSRSSPPKTTEVVTTSPPTMTTIEPIRQILQSATQIWPEMTDEALERVLDYFSSSTEEHTRRTIALTRLAFAEARLLGDEQVSANHVDSAAKVIKLSTPIDRNRFKTPSLHDSPPSSTPLSKPDEQKKQPLVTKRPNLVEPPTSCSVTIQKPVYESEPPEPFSATPLPAYTPYPEDTAPIERHSAPLRLPFRRNQTSGKQYGPIIGTEPTNVVHDIAIASTLLEAAKYQTMRKKQTQQDSDYLIVLPTDLRCYRRSPIAKQMFVLLLDYTSLKQSEWQEALLPYLQWSYMERTSVCLIQVGTKDAANELQASRILAANILMPPIEEALEAEHGRATPLAHGLELAEQTLRHALQHGRTTINAALLIVLTDGRGNVPLQASHSGHLLLPVKRQGIDDTLLVAQKIRQLPRVETVLLNPQPAQYTNLPHQLATALGATIANIPHSDSVEIVEEDHVA